VLRTRRWRCCCGHGWLHRLLVINVHRDILWAAGASASSSSCCCCCITNTLLNCSRLRRLLRLLLQALLLLLLLLLQQQHLRLLVCHQQQPPLRQREQHGPQPATAADAAGDVHFKRLISASDADAVVVAEGLVAGRTSD
jgi:hypothetical protein